LDSTQFSPKVLTLFDDAKAEQKKARCETFCREIDRLSRSGDAQALIRMAKDAGGSCACGAAADAAELLYKQGVDAYKHDDLGQAIEKLRAALKYRPQHDLAAQYLELTESRVKLTVDLTLLDWHRYFDAQEFPKASVAYQQLAALNFQATADAALEQIRGEYRKTVSSKVEAWNQSCSTNASESLDAVRRQTRDLLPDETIAADLLSKLSPCAPKVPETAVAAAAAVPPPVPPVSPVPPEACVQMATQFAMVRLKHRVDPELRGRAPLVPLNISVKIRIDQNGNVSVKEIAGGDPYINEAMRAAVEQWKFLPAIVEDHIRCVDTELPIVLRRS
jgi:hypothetical protein